MKTTTLSVPPPPLPLFRFWGNLGQFWAISHRLSVRTALRPPPPPHCPQSTVCVCRGGRLSLSVCFVPFFFGGGEGRSGGLAFRGCCRLLTILGFFFYGAPINVPISIEESLCGVTPNHNVPPSLPQNGVM